MSDSKSEQPRYFLSPVDYTAWGNGYMPPSDHILIDQLMFRGARPVLSADYGDFAFWLVIRGNSPSAKVMRLVGGMLSDACDDIAADPPSRPMTGFFESLTPEQRAALHDYNGDDGEDHLGGGRKND